MLPLQEEEASSQNVADSAGQVVSHVSDVYLTPLIVPPMAPQQVWPGAQSLGRLHASGASQARALHAVLGVVGELEKSMQQCSPRAQSASLSQRKTRSQLAPSFAQVAVALVVIIIETSRMQQISPADLSQLVFPQRIMGGVPGPPPAPTVPPDSAPPVLPESALPPVLSGPASASRPPLPGVTPPLPIRPPEPRPPLPLLWLPPADGFAPPAPTLPPVVPLSPPDDSAAPPASLEGAEPPFEELLPPLPDAPPAEAPPPVAVSSGEPKSALFESVVHAPQ